MIEGSIFERPHRIPPHRYLQHCHLFIYNGSAKPNGESDKLPGLVAAASLLSMWSDSSLTGPSNAFNFKAQGPAIGGEGRSAIQLQGLRFPTHIHAR